MTSCERMLSGVLALVGLAIWIGTGLLAGEKEAWDSPEFFLIAVPLMAALAFVSSFVKPGSSWLRGVSLVVLQPIALVAMSGERLGPLWVVGVVYFAFIASLCALAALLGALSHRALQGRPDHDDLH